MCACVPMDTETQNCRLLWVPDTEQVLFHLQLPIFIFKTTHTSFFFSLRYRDKIKLITVPEGRRIKIQTQVPITLLSSDFSPPPPGGRVLPLAWRFRGEKMFLTQDTGAR